MKHRIQGLVMGFLAAIMLMSATVYAATGESPVKIIYNNIKILIDGKEYVAKDSAGKIVEPFSLNGTIYLPVRAVANAFGKEVAWDGANATVMIGAKTSTWLDSLGVYDFKTLTLSEYESTGKINDFDRGIIVRQRFDSKESDPENEITILAYLLNGSYSKFSCKLDALYTSDWSDSYITPTTLKIYGDGKVLYTSPAFKNGIIPYDIDIDISNVSNLTFEFQAKGSSNIHGIKHRSIVLGNALLSK